MTAIYPSFGDTKHVVQEMSDCVCIEPTPVTITSANVGGVGIVTATYPAFNCVFDGVTHYVAAGSGNLNTADVASPTTFYVYFMEVAGVPVFTVSTTNPSADPTVDEFFVTNIVRFKSVGGTVTFYIVKYPSQNGVYELAHNLKGDVMFYDPMWIGGLAPSLSAGGKLSTASGYVRFPGNEPRVVDAITNGALMLEDESATVVGLDNIATYADGSAIAAGDFVKLLIGVVRGDSLLAGQYRVMRQAKPAAPYGTRAAALADAENMAATAFGISYRAAITPLCYVITQMGAGATSDYTQTGAYPTGDIIDLRETGLTGGGGGGGAGVTSHGSLADLDVIAHHPSYLVIGGTRPLTADWDAGSYEIRALTFESDIATGSGAPFTVASSAKVSNLNADQLDGYDATAFLQLAGGTMSGALNMGSKSITSANDVGTATVTASGLAKALTLESTQTTGTAPITVASTTVCSNLNADKVDGKDAADFLLLAGGTMTGAIAMGSKSITGADDVGCATLTASGNAKALTLQSTQTTGTAPLTVASTTVVSNLNADKVDGKDAADFLLLAGGTMTGAIAMGSKSITGADDVGCATVTATGLAKALTLQSTQTTGTAPLAVASTTVVTNLNADTVDGIQGANIITADGNTALTGNWAAAKNITTVGDMGCAAFTASGLSKALTFESTQTTGTAPIAVASTTVCSNLNADKVDGYDGTAFLQLAGGTMTGALNMGSKSITAADDVGCATVTATGNAKALTLQSTQTTGTAPLTVASTTKVTNLNADQLDGLDDTAFLKADGSVTLTGNMLVGNGITIDGVDIGAHAANANAHHNAVTLGTSADNNLLSLSTQAIDLDTQTALYTFCGPVSGAAAAPSFKQLDGRYLYNPSASLTLGGVYDNIPLTAGTFLYHITTEGANFAITGFAMSGGNVDGMVIRIVNLSGKTMTLTNDSTSTPANRIYNGSATIPYLSGVNLVYIGGTINRWCRMV